MLQPATIPPMTISSTTSSGPRPRQNRKSAITAGIQSQQQAAQRQQTHARHQSMPAQSKPNRDGHGNNNIHSNKAQVSILKRSSNQSTPSSPQTPASPSAKTQKAEGGILAVSKADLALKSNNTPPNNPRNRSHQQQQQQHQQHQHQHQHQHHQQQHQQHQHVTSKSKRVQRRKDVVASTESIAAAEMDAALNQSPPLSTISPPSSTDSSSDDSEAPASSRSPNLHPRVARGLATSPPQRPMSAPVTLHNRKAPYSNHASVGISVHGLQVSITRNPMHEQHEAGLMRLKPSFGSTSSLPSQGSNGLQQLRPNHPTSSLSADKVLLADRIAAEKADKNGLYAGPTFHNSPAPTSLPIPAFNRLAGSSPAEKPAEIAMSPSFGEAASPHLNSMRQRTQSDNRGLSMKPMSYPGLDYDHPFTTYNLPERMATLSYPEQGLDQLMEISQNLRNLLKIQIQ